VPRLSVVIPALGRLDVLRRVLDDLERQKAARDDFEVVLVADAAEQDKDSVAGLVAGRPYAARFLAAEQRGASAARNLGWREASAPLVLFLGADILPAPTLVAEHLSWHERHPDERVGVLGRVRWAREL
jgi:glycosyltransferase involved in cell wall biosynthesis